MFPLALLLALLWLYPLLVVAKESSAVCTNTQDLHPMMEKSHIQIVLYVQQNAKAHWTFPYYVKTVACLFAPQFWEFISEMCSKIYGFGSHAWSWDNRGTLNFVAIFQIFGSVQNFTNFPSLELNSKWIQKMWSLSKWNKCFSSLFSPLNWWLSV